MKNKSVLIILLLGILALGNAQEKDVVLTKKEESAISVLKATLFFGNSSSPTFFDNQEFKFRRDSDGTLEMAAKINPGLTDLMMGDRFTKYRISTASGLSGLIELYNECERVTFIRIDQWEGDKAIKTGSHMDDGTLLYDSANRIIGLDKGISYRRKGNAKIYRKTKLNIGYDTKGRMNKLEEEILFYEKSNSSKNLKEDYTFKKWVSKLEYSKNKVAVFISNFREDEKEIYKSMYTSYLLTKSAYATRVEKEQITYRRNGEEKQHTYLEKKAYDTKYRLTQHETETASSIKTIAYVYDEQDNIIQENHKYERNSEVSEEIITQTFDKRNLPIQSKKVLKTNGAIRETQEKKHTYIPKKEGTEITKCTHKLEFLTTFYNAEGEAFKESNGNKLRMKKDGAWGSWEFYSY